MSKPCHIFSNGRLEQHENTLKFIEIEEDEEQNIRHLPVESVSRICFHGQIDINTQALQHLQQHNITCAIFGWYGNYIGEFYPKSSQLSGNTVTHQSEAYNKQRQRINIAKKIVDSSIHNMKRSLEYYERKGDLSEADIKMFEIDIDNIHARRIEDVLGTEAEYRKKYYSLFPKIVSSSEFTFDKRTYNPPENKLNALISFGNSLLYSTVVSQIYKTDLNPTVSYLHEPSERRNSLALDIADIFKPNLVDRVLFKVINTNQIQKSDFKEKEIGYHLTEDARKLFVEKYESMLSETVEHPQLNRNVSHEYLIRLDLYNLQKHVASDEEYRPFKRWW